MSSLCNHKRTCKSNNENVHESVSIQNEDKTITITANEFLDDPSTIIQIGELEFYNYSGQIQDNKILTESNVRRHVIWPRVQFIQRPTNSVISELSVDYLDVAPVDFKDGVIPGSKTRRILAHCGFGSIDTLAKEMLLLMEEVKEDSTPVAKKVPLTHVHTVELLSVLNGNWNDRFEFSVPVWIKAQEWTTIDAEKRISTENSERMMERMLSSESER